jgi:hypothetical protein
MCLVIDVEIPPDRNVMQEKAEKEMKYNNLSIQMQVMWNMKCFFTPVIPGVTGIVTKGLKIFGKNTRETFSRFSTKNRT